MITVGDILTFEQLGNIEVVAGLTGLNRAINWVTILEVLDELDHLEEGDLLVTTGYGLFQDQKLQEQLIPILAEKQLAGLAIQPGFYLHEIPSLIIQKADELDFPVLKLPSDLAFKKLTQNILRQIISLQNHLLKYSEDIYHKFINIVLKNQGLQEIAETLSQLIQRPVKFINILYEPLCTASFSDQEVKWPALFNLGKSGIKFQAKKVREISVEEKKIWLMPITTGFETLGYTCIMGNEADLEEMEIIAIGHATALAALVFAKEQAIKDVENKQKEEFLELGISGATIGLAKKASSLGYDTKKGYYLMIFQYEKEEPIITDKSPAFLWRWQVLNVVESIFAKENFYFMHKFLNQQLLLFIQPNCHPSVDMMKLLCLDMIKKMEEASLLGSQKIHMGVSNFHLPVKEIKEAFTEASRAVEIGIKLNQKVTHIHEHDLFNFYMDMPNTEFLASFVEKTLGKVKKNDLTYRNDLLITLNTYLSCNSNIQETSARLFIHRQTLRYRLKKLEKILDVDLHDHNIKLKLQLALSIAQFLES
ncbi:MAG: PucR family transcriptional regulator [Dehalobacterium sp.]